MIAAGVWPFARKLARAVLFVSSVLVLVGQPLPPAVLAHAPVQDAAEPQANCQYVSTQRTTQLTDPAIREASGLVASREHAGVYWTLNDSGNGASIFAFGQDGASRGAFHVPGAGNVDWEAIQLGPDGEDGHALYIGDIGDNDYVRRKLSIYRIPEPDLTRSGGETAPPTVFTFSYPTILHNTEAMLVHPLTGEVVLITREMSGVSMIFRLPLPLDSQDVMVAEFLDVIDVRAIDSASSQITDAAISSDGRHVALRTYGSLLLFDVPEDGELDAIWSQQPRVYRLADGRKGEGLAFKVDTDDVMSIGEERPAALYQTSWQC